MTLFDGVLQEVPEPQITLLLEKGPPRAMFRTLKEATESWMRSWEALARKKTGLGRCFFKLEECTSLPGEVRLRYSASTHKAETNPADGRLHPRKRI